jgi:hypothetical protein
MMLTQIISAINLMISTYSASATLRGTLVCFDDQRQV